MKILNRKMIVSQSTRNGFDTHRNGEKMMRCAKREWRSAALPTPCYIQGPKECTWQALCRLVQDWAPEEYMHTHARTHRYISSFIIQIDKKSNSMKRRMMDKSQYFSLIVRKYLIVSRVVNLLPLTR